MNILRIRVYDKKDIFMSFNFRGDRFLPASVRFGSSSVESLFHFSESTDRGLKKIGDRAKELKDREALTIDKLSDKAYDAFSKCKNVDELEKVRNELKDEERSTSAQYIKEVVDDSKELVDDARDWQVRKGLADKPLDSIRQESDKIIDTVRMEEGKTLTNHLNAIDHEFNEIKQHQFKQDGTKYSDSMFHNPVIDNLIGRANDKGGSRFDESKGKAKDKDGSGSDESKGKDKQSPLDYVIEKQSGEMPDITESDGGD